MKKLFFSAMVLFSTVSSLQAQNRNFKFDVYGGLSKPSGDYKMPLGRANGGYVTGIAFDYYFLEGMIGLGIDARIAGHSHTGLDTLKVDNATLFSDYSTPEQFKYKGLFIGPTFQNYIGNLGLELYAKGGIVNQQMPRHDRHLLFFLGSSMRDEVVFTTPHPENSNAFAVVAGFRINYKLNNWLGVFMMGDYQDHLSGQGYEIKGLQPQFNYPAQETPEGTAKVKMMNFGAGLRFTFGGGRDWDSLSEY